MAVVVRVLAATGWEPAVFLALSPSSKSQFVEEVVGRDLPNRGSQGHDGKFYFVQAVDPFMLDPDIAAEYLDRPLYRAQRMLYPVLASGFGLVPDPWLPWTMLLVNVMALAAGTYATSRVAVNLGGPAWWGLAFPLNPGLLMELFIGGSGIVAFALAMLAVAMAQEERWWAASFWFAGAALSREAVLVFVAGVALLIWRRHGISRALQAAMTSVVAVIVWGIYLRLRLPSRSSVTELREFSWPLQGIADAFPKWLNSPADLVTAIILLGIGVTLVRRCIDRPTYVGWGATGFLVLGVVLSRNVWSAFFDMSRALAPVITAYVLVSFAADGTDLGLERRGDRSGSTTDTVGS